jgi:vacuolar-type H+-ATPase subunit I/STV1
MLSSEDNSDLFNNFECNHPKFRQSLEHAITTNLTPEHEANEYHLDKNWIRKVIYTAVLKIIKNDDVELLDLHHQNGLELNNPFHEGIEDSILDLSIKFGASKCEKLLRQNGALSYEEAYKEFRQNKISDDMATLQGDLDLMEERKKKYEKKLDFYQTKIDQINSKISDLDDEIEAFNNEHEELEELLGEYYE